MSIRLFERRGMGRRLAERRRYDRRMTIPAIPLDVERRQVPERREGGFDRRDFLERRDH